MGGRAVLVLGDVAVNRARHEGLLPIRKPGHAPDSTDCGDGSSGCEVALVRAARQRPEQLARQVGMSVTDARTKGIILDALSDETSRKILKSTTAGARSVEELTSETKVPMSTVYRRAHELAEAGLLFVEWVGGTKKTKRYATYRSLLGGTSVTMDTGGVQVWVSPNTTRSRLR